jgi:hypothetical protein
MLMALLRTPKTRAGLIAAVEADGITKNFVYGFLSQSQREGTVTQLKSMNPVQYQATEFIVVERPAERVFPTWLEPRSLPTSIGRRTYIDGVAVTH